MFELLIQAAECFIAFLRRVQAAAENDHEAAYLVSLLKIGLAACSIVLICCSHVIAAGLMGLTSGLMTILSHILVFWIPGAAVALLSFCLHLATFFTLPILDFLFGCAYLLLEVVGGCLMFISATLALIVTASLISWVCPAFPFFGGFQVNYNYGSTSQRQNSRGSRGQIQFRSRAF